jgi:prepilin-type N-terminal cleavage/methylation domain-containing protein
MKKDYYKRGFTMTELLISIFILTLFTITATTFQKDVFSLNTFFQSSLNVQLDARHVIKGLVAELRRAQPSNFGDYPVAVASSSAITFFSDINSDGTREIIRYFVSGTDLKKGVMIATGTPVVYGSESITTIMSGLVSSSTQPLFQYYPSSYAGTSTPLTYPISIPSIRLVKVTAIIDRDPGRSPTQVVVTSQVSLRNLKDNL